MVTYTVPGMKSDDADKVVTILQDRLNSFNDLALTLKHVHWNEMCIRDRPGPHQVRVVDKLGLPALTPRVS